jgi:catalase
VKYRWKPKLGLQSVIWNEAQKINGADPDFHRRDLQEAIATGAYPEWELQMQIFDDEFAAKLPFDHLDSTKMIPEEDLPFRTVGRLVLNRWVENNFAETEQVAFCTQNIVPGMDFTDDPLLQGRNFSYLDTQLIRLGGPNFPEIDINRPRGCPMFTLEQDGYHRNKNPKGRANYEPNSWTQSEGPREVEAPRESPDTGFRSYPVNLGGTKIRARSETFSDHYSQARQFYISQTRVEKQQIIEAFTFELTKARFTKIRERMVAHLRNVDHGLAVAISRNLGLKELPPAITPARPVRTDLKPCPSLSIVLNAPGFLTGRKIGVFCSEGADSTVLDAINTLAAPEGLLVEYICLAAEGFTDSKGGFRKGNEIWASGLSVLYDTVAVVVSEAEARNVSVNPYARDFVNDAFMHFKFIAYTEPALILLKSSGIDPTNDGGMMKISGVKDCTEFMAVGRKFLRFWERGQFAPETA